MKNFSNKKIIITGSTGDLGLALLKQLSKENIELFLISSKLENFNQIKSDISFANLKINYFASDLSSVDGIKEAANYLSKISNPDILINLAGVSFFGSLGQQDYKEIEKLYNVNLLAPTILTQSVLPEMIKKGSGHIVNIGSIFGSISFPFFATYSASKFALRGFSESLRREICDSKVKVIYIAPRAINTKINKGKISEFLSKTKSNIDQVDDVAKKIISTIKLEKSISYLGFQESIFVRINSLFPKIVDLALKKVSHIAREILCNSK